jgi:endoglucanase
MSTIKKVTIFSLMCISSTLVFAQKSLMLNDSNYFEARGINFLVFHNLYGQFGDEKLSGIEIIHHGVRTATNGDVRLAPSPAQWDSIPSMVKRNVLKKEGKIEADLQYKYHNFPYKVSTRAEGNDFIIEVSSDVQVPASLEGKAGFNLEFLPSSYFHKSYIADGRAGTFPIYPSGTEKVNGVIESKALASGRSILLSPEDTERKIEIVNEMGTLSLYDGRNIAQNGWFVVRSLLATGKTGVLAKWRIKAYTIPNWTRKPVIGHSQVGYHPKQRKQAIIELDKNDNKLGEVSLIEYTALGANTVLKTKAKKWGNYLRYQYVTFDFSSIVKPGTYKIQYGDISTLPFVISDRVYDDVWHLTNDIFFNVQMDHVTVNEAYRIWHGASHLDDALQAPINTPHFDLYRQGPKTDTKFAPGEHIPGLNVGGWYDAGDFDIRTQTVYACVSSLVQIWETFKPMRDETLVDQKKKYVDIHHPDGTPDIVQQVEHGALFLLSHYKAVGQALNGIVEAHLDQYTHLGDGSTKTDNKVYNAKLKDGEDNGYESGTFDDRWAFTNKSTPLDYGSIAALAAASRVLKGYNDALAAECLATAKKVWIDEHNHAPIIFRHGNTTGGGLESEEIKAAVELFVTTGDKSYLTAIEKHMGFVERAFGFSANYILRIWDELPPATQAKLTESAKTYAANQAKIPNPYGVPVTGGGWAGSGAVIGSGVTSYLLHKKFPEIVSKESVFKSLHFLFGTHPYSDISLVSGVGTRSKEVAYGNNRADFSFIAGGIVPGILIVKPDFPENKEDWPFLWGENEYVVNLGASYMYLVHAANDLLKN